MTMLKVAKVLKISQRILMEVFFILGTKIAVHAKIGNCHGFEGEKTDKRLIIGVESFREPCREYLPYLWEESPIKAR